MLQRRLSQIELGRAYRALQEVDDMEDEHGETWTGSAAGWVGVLMRVVVAVVMFAAFLIAVSSL